MSTATLKGALAAPASAAQAPGAKPMNKYDVLKHKLQAARADLRTYLGSDAAVDRFISTATSAVVANPDLLEADERSLLVSIKKAAIDGLEPNGSESALVIYNTKIRDSSGRERWVKSVQYMPMRAGFVKLLYESGATYVDACAVYERDVFKFTRGDAPSIVHEPFLGSDPGEVVAAYCVVKLDTGEIKREVMPRRDVDRVRSVSKNAERGAWKEWLPEMAEKSVIKRISKQIPRADRLRRLVDSDNALGYAPSLAGTATLGDIAPTTEGERPAGAADAGATPPPAVTHDPSPTLDPMPPRDDDPMTIDAEQEAGLREAEQRGETSRDEPTDLPSDPPAEAPPRVTYAAVATAVHKAQNNDDLDAARDLQRHIEDAGQRAEIDGLIAGRKAELAKRGRRV